MAEPRHFLDLDKVGKDELRRILDLGSAYKNGHPPHGEARPLAGKALALIFEKPSTRTRVSFDVGMRQLGGETVVLGHNDTQLGRGETLGDTARVLSRYVDAIVLRTTSESKLLEMAEHATVPVINGLTDRTHPCQLMADIMTFEEHQGAIKDRKVAWSGDGNNMATSWIQAAVQFDFRLAIACPPELEPPADVVGWARREGGKISLVHSAEQAVADADCVVTDAWVSMGDADAEVRHNLLAPFRIDDEVMARAKADAIFMHCLPAHRDEEMAASVIDGPQSVVWDEAENRLHAQKGILAWCLSGRDE